MKLTPALKLSLCLLGTAACSFAEEAAPAAAPAAAEQTFTESQIIETFGWYVGSQVGANEMEFTAEQKAALLKGFNQALAGDPVPFPLQQIGPKIQEFLTTKQQAFQEKAAVKGKAEADTFFTELKKKEGIVALPSGLCYEIIQAGTGANPKATDTVKVHYTGTLLNGTKFDSSVDRGEPAEFPLNQVIPGWTEGLQKVQKGGKIKLYVPSELGYGTRGAPPTIPPNSTLVFDVELLDITPAAE